MTFAEPYRPNARVTLVAAVARNGVIGRDGQLPWRLPTDLKAFKALTMGKPMIMGRKQYASVGKPLPGRENIILSRDASFTAPGCIVVNTLDAALRHADTVASRQNIDEIMIIGGGEIYRLALPFADRIHLTRVALHVDGDVTFPALDPAIWYETARERLERTPADEADAETFVYARNTPGKR